MSEITEKSSLDELRARIDEIDHELVHLLKRRFDVTRQVGLFKKEHGLEATDPDREKLKYERFSQLCRQAGLDPEFGEKVLKVIIAQVVENHRKC